MKLKIEHVYSQNASGHSKSISGGRDLQKAIKLEKQGLAKIKFINSKFIGFGKSRDFGYSANIYEVSFL